MFKKEADYAQNLILLQLSAGATQCWQAFLFTFSLQIKIKMCRMYVVAAHA